MNTFIRSRTFIGLTGVVAALFLLAGSAFAEEENPSQVNLQLTGLVNSDSTNNGITDHVTHSGGLLINYTHLLNKWAGLEGGYGYSRNTNNYTSIGTDLDGVQTGVGGVQTNVNEFTGAFVLRMPVRIAKVRPYALAGTGALNFRPTSDLGNFAGATSQTKGVFLYGFGADFNLTSHLGLRADYRGFVYNAPDFDVDGLKVGATTHLAQPSVGIYFRF